MFRRVDLVAGGFLLSVAVLLSPPIFGRLVGELDWVGLRVHWTGFALFVVLAVAAAGLARLGRRGALRSALTRRPRTLALLSGLALVVLLGVGIELFFRFGDRLRYRPVEVVEGSYTTEFFEDRPLLGYGPIPGAKVDAIKKVDGRTIYDVTYTIEESGRRWTPSAAGRASDTVVLFFGGSNTFGEGVDDDETLPHNFGLLAPDVEVHNVGFCGYGPQQMLARLESGELDDLITGKRVQAVYLFIDPHVARAVGSMVVVTAWGSAMPYYVLEDGRPILRGSFLSERPLTNWFYALASTSRTLRHYNIDLPVPSARHYRLTARIIEASADYLGRWASTGRLYLALHPTVTTASRLTPHITDPRVTVLDHTGLWDRRDTDYMIEGDWHPTPLAHHTLAERLAARLSADNR